MNYLQTNNTQDDGYWMDIHLPDLRLINPYFRVFYHETVRTVGMAISADGGIMICFNDKSKFLDVVYVLGLDLKQAEKECQRAELQRAQHLKRLAH